MELTRLSRAIGARWATVAIVALVGVFAAVLFSTLSERNQTEVFEAIAAIRLVPAEGETIADLTDDIDEAQNLASIAATDLLVSDPNSLIVADIANSRVQFIAQGATADEASTKARALLQAFLDVDPTVGGSVDELLVEIVVEAVSIEAEIARLNPQPTDEDLDQLNAIGLIDGNIAAINGRLTALLVTEAAADAETRQAIATERAALNSQVIQLEAEKEALGELAAAELSVSDALLLTTLELRMVSLATDYQRLYLRKLGVTGQGGVEPVVVADLTPEPLDPWVTAAVGLLGGLLIAVATIIFVNRTRKTVWLSEDIDIAVLAEMPARKVSADTADSWYDTAEPGVRKASIQALRSAVEAHVSPGDATIALTGHAVAPEGVQALAADLASSLASAGTSVLLIDVNFDSRSPLGKYVARGASVAHVLDLNPAAPDFDAEIRHSIESAYLVRAGLTVIPSGPAPASSADALAGRQFRQLIFHAQQQHDVVVVVVDDIDTPSGQVAIQRLGHGLLVLTPGTSTAPAVNGILNDISRLRISMLGAVFLGKPDRLAFGRRNPKRPSESSTPAQPELPESAPQSPISRLHNYPIPEERQTAVVSHGSLDDLAGHMGANRNRKGSEFGMQLLEAINTAGPEQAFDSVADYLVSQTEDMVSARFGHGGLSDELIDFVSEYGFITLRPMKGLRTPSAWLAHEIENDVDIRTALDLVDAMERTLGVGSPRRIDDWLIEEFFIRHIERTDGEPSVWHLSSPEGSIGVLVSARRLDVDRFDMLLTEVVKREIDDLERFRRSMVTRGDHEQADMFDGQIHDVRQFEGAVLGLIASDSGRGKSLGESRGWNPDWSLGTRANLAPLQRVGLLPFNVLSDEEISEFSASV